MTELPLDSFRSSTLGWLRGTLAGWATILLIIGGIVLTLLLPAGEGGPWPLGFAVLGLVIILVKWVQNLLAKFEITEERIVIRHGIIFKSIDEIELYRVKDVRIDFTLINQVAGIGTIRISSSDETTREGDLVMRHIERAQARREQLRRLVDSARQKRQVREIDMVHEDFAR
ncbi:MAG TPA: PH domain-containing protein [Allosphingosinicella sp.]|nr:PH domain-containing protein [Allosphingosinicella sp.]